MHGAYIVLTWHENERVGQGVLPILSERPRVVVGQKVNNVGQVELGEGVSVTLCHHFGLPLQVEHFVGFHRLEREHVRQNLLDPRVVEWQKVILFQHSIKNLQ